MAEAGLLAHTPFHTRDRLNANFELLGGKIPVLIIDGIYDHPHDVRRDALALDYRTPNYPYPGRIAEIPYKNASLIRFLDNILGLVNSTYLPRIPPIESVDSPGALTAFRSLHTDFAIVDRHPDELIDVQRAPHIDAVPIFGLIYLNEAERGGTLFFERADVASRVRDLSVEQQSRLEVCRPHRRQVQPACHLPRFCPPFGGDRRRLDHD